MPESGRGDCGASAVGGRTLSLPEKRTVTTESSTSRRDGASTIDDRYCDHGGPGLVSAPSLCSESVRVTTHSSVTEGGLVLRALPAGPCRETRCRLNCVLRVHVSPQAGNTFRRERPQIACERYPRSLWAAPQRSCRVCRAGTRSLRRKPTREQGPNISAVTETCAQYSRGRDCDVGPGVLAKQSRARSSWGSRLCHGHGGDGLA